MRFFLALLWTMVACAPGIYRAIDRGSQAGVSAEGNTLLHHAARMGNAAMVALLLERGADPELRNRRGQTPEMVAESRGQALTAQMLRARAKAPNKATP